MLINISHIHRNEAIIIAHIVRLTLALAAGLGRVALHVLHILLLLYGGLLLLGFQRCVDGDDDDDDDDDGY